MTRYWLLRHLTDHQKSFFDTESTKTLLRHGSPVANMIIHISDRFDSVLDHIHEQDDTAQYDVYDWRRRVWYSSDDLKKLLDNFLNKKYGQLIN